MLALAMIAGGFVLWLPACGGPSTATSDLGLSLMGGGLALTGGFVVAVVVYEAEQRFQRALRQREEAAARENLKLTLSMTPDLSGVDLHGRDLRGIVLRNKDLRHADLRQANLSDATCAGVKLDDALLNDADLRRAIFGLSSESNLRTVSLIGADLLGADLRGAKIRGDIRRSNFDVADLRGADLSRALAGHPHPDEATQEDLASEAASFDGAKYDDDTQWPHGVDPKSAGAVRA